MVFGKNLVFAVAAAVSIVVFVGSISTKFARLEDNQRQQGQAIVNDNALLNSNLNDVKIQIQQERLRQIEWNRRAGNRLGNIDTKLAAILAVLKNPKIGGFP